MQARRRWTMVATMSPSDRSGPLVSGVRKRPFPVGNERYASPRAHLDRDAGAARFESVEGWRESMRRDATMRAVMLNPVDYEPRGD